MARTSTPYTEDPGFLGELAQWNEAKAALDAAKEKERELRDALYYRIIATHRPDGDIVPGTYNLAIPNQWKISAVASLDYKVDEAALPGITEELPEGTLDRILKYKPELSRSQYKLLTMELKAIVDQALIIKPSTPQLKLVPPPVKKVM